jgi:hypothetical protein
LVCHPATALSFSTDGNGALSGAWTNSDSAITNYTFTLYRNNVVQSTVTKTTSDPASYSATGMPAGSYFYRILTHCSNGLNATATSNTVVIAACAVSVSGLTLTTDEDDLFHLQWTNNGGTPSTLVIEYSLNGGTTWTVADMTVNGSANAAQTNAAFDMTRNYKWRVTPYCSPNRPGTSATVNVYLCGTNLFTGSQTDRYLCQW